MKGLWFVLAVVGLLGLPLTLIPLRAESPEAALAAYSESLKKKFPSVKTIMPAELASVRSHPLLIDVREEKEFAVSHLEGAYRAEADVMQQLERMGAVAGSPIVVYCSVGYRSSVLAVKLQEAGFQNVRNLEGSLFAWANAGLPMVNADGLTTGVHPFNALWGRFLHRSMWKWKPLAGE